jgi:uncharacterized protein YjbI with pentapeptide repeats
MDVSQLRGRWQGGEGDRLVRAVLDALSCSAGDVETLVGRTDEGLLDLRGLMTPAPFVTDRREAREFHFEELGGLTELRECVVRDADFSHAVLDGLRFHGCRFENVRFDGAHVRELRMWQSSFADCTFDHAKLGGWTIGGVENRVRNCLERCSFVRADLRGAAGGAPHFEHCVFDHARLDRVDFDGGLFRRCVFRGRLVEVGFSRRSWAQKVNEDNDMLEVDFSDAELIYTTFRDLPLATVTWPTSETHVLFSHPSCVMKHLRAEMWDNGTPDARGIAGLIDATLQNSHPKRATGIFHEEELGSMSTHIRERTAELERLCSTQDTHWWRRFSRRSEP